MPYSTIDSVSRKMNQTTLIQLLNDEVRADEEIDLTDPNDLIVVRFNQAADEAQQEIDPSLRFRYTLPFVTVPGIITNLSDNFTIYYIYMRRNREIMPDSIMSIRKEGLNTLDDISKGLIDLGIALEPQNISNEIRTNKTAKDRIFDKNLWTKF
jgi:phage gp36-like protein